MLTIGADPEFWLVKRDTGRPVSADFLEYRLGTKTAPRRLDCGGAVQVDGTAVEFNIRPAATPKEFTENMRTTLNEVRGLIPKEYAFDFSPIRTYTPAMWKKIPDKSKEIGCDPEEHAYYKPWTRQTKKAQRSRGAGGHIHFGWTEGRNTKDDEEHRQDCKYFAQFLSRNMRAKVMRMTGYDEREYERVNLTGYGSEGAYRVKPYGMEYRALSSRWVARPDVWEDLFNLCVFMFEEAQHLEQAQLVRGGVADNRPYHTWME